MRFALALLILILGWSALLWANSPNPGPSKLTPAARAEIEANLQKVMKRVEHDSQYRDVSRELEVYKAYAEELGRRPSEIKRYSERYQARGIRSVQSEAKKCQPSYDLRNETLGPVRNQDSVGWCYAFSAADLLTHKTGQKISAADLALVYSDGWLKSLLMKAGEGEQDFDGGWVARAINRAVEKGGACLEENLRSEDNGYASLLETLKTIDAAKRKNAPLAAVENCPTAVKSLFPKLLNMKDSLEIIERTSREQLIRSLSDAACAPRVELQGIEAQMHAVATVKGREQIFDRIDEQLAKSNIVAIGYNSRLLYDIDSETSRRHSSVVVGRRFNGEKGECEYLIRNSWGRGCSSYDRSLTCEEGNIWMPKSVLVKGIRNASYIE